MERANRVAFISYCDKLGLGARLMLGVRSPCEHRRLPDPLSKYILNTRQALWTRPTEISVSSEMTDGSESLLVGEEGDSSPLRPLSVNANSQSDISNSHMITWEARPVNLLEAKYEPFTMFIVNTPITSAESVALLPSLYNYFVTNYVSKVIVVTSLDLRPSELALLSPLTVGEHQIRGRFKDFTASSAASMASSNTGGSRLQLHEILLNSCPSFGFSPLAAAEWLTSDPFLVVLSQIFSISRIPGAIVGTVALPSDGLSFDRRNSVVNDCAWRLANAIHNTTGVSFDLEMIECMNYNSPDDESGKQKLSSLFV